MPENKVLSTVPAHFHSFSDRARVANAFQDHVRAVAAAQVAHGLNARFGCFDFVNVDHVAGPEAEGHFQSGWRRAEHDDFGRARGFGHGQR